MTPTQQLAEAMAAFSFPPLPSPVFCVSQYAAGHRIWQWVDVIARNNGNLSDEELRTTKDLVGIVSR